MFLGVLILLSLCGVLSQNGEWGVNYPAGPVCAVAGSSVSIPCNYSHPPDHRVKEKLWCSKNNTNSLCRIPPYVYNSSANTTSDFQYAGDDASDCTLFIRNVQSRYSGEFRFRFITDKDGERFTGAPGAELQVTDMKVSLIRLSGAGTLKEGDSVNLTCDVNCTHNSSQFVWSKNAERLPQPGPVLHLPALTVRDSGNYTCTWNTNQTSESRTISLHVEGSFLWYTGFGVKYPEKPICAVRGFRVLLPCYYYYPFQNHRLRRKLWCSINSDRDYCIDPPYVYDSLSNTTSDFEYVGDNTSDCTLLIRNVQSHYSGEYRFRFITDVTDGKYTGVPGATLQVTDMKVSLIRLSGNGTLKEGDSVNLTCDVNCTHSSSQFVWSKNAERLPEPGPVLHLPALTVRDSGNYNCTWNTNHTSGSKSISLHVEGEGPHQWQIRIIAVVIAVGGLIILVFFGVVIYHWRRKDDAPDDRSKKVEEEAQVGQDPQPNEEVLQQTEVVYASVCVKDKNLNNRYVQTENPNEDKTVIYSTVAIK